MSLQVLPLPGLRLDTLLTSEEFGFGLPATPLQRAIYRLCDGLPLEELADDPDVAAALGLEENPNVMAELPRSMPREFYMIAGIRTAKSLMAAAIAIRAARTVNLMGLRPGEIARVSIVSTSTDNAQVIFGHLRGTVEAQPALTELMASPFRTDSVLLKHPSGRVVEIKVVAGAKSGASLVARWSAGAIFDEFPRMQGEGEATVNFDALRKSVIFRLLPGAQLVAIGSPYSDTGPAYKVVIEGWGHPSKDRVVLYGVPGAKMNPVYFTPEFVEESKKDPQAHQTDVLGRFAAEFAGLFATGQLEKCLRREPLALPRWPGHHYVAALDPATRTNAWTMVVLTRDEHDNIVIAFARQWVPEVGRPLDPDAVLEEIARELVVYGIQSAVHDQWGPDLLRKLGRRAQLFLRDDPVTPASKVDAFDTLRLLVAGESISIPSVPDMADDLRRVRRRLTRHGIVIDLPLLGGRHCDYASAVALGLTQIIAPPVKPTKRRVRDEDEDADDREWLSPEF